MEKLRKLFVLYEEAVALKELGFDENCFGFFREYCDKQLLMMPSQLPKYEEKHLVKYIENGTLLPAPTYQQAFTFFEEKFSLHFEILLDRTTTPKYCFEIYKYEHFGNYTKIPNPDFSLYGTKQQAELECLKQLIKTAKINFINNLEIR